MTSALLLIAIFPIEVSNPAGLMKHLRTLGFDSIDGYSSFIIPEPPEGFDEFRAADVFPSERPADVTVVDDWVAANGEKYDFNTLGWPAWYPTRTLAEWKAARALWEPYVMRSPDENIPRPSTVHSRKKNKKKKE